MRVRRSLISGVLAAAVLLLIVLPVGTGAAVTLAFYAETLAGAPLSRQEAASLASGRATEMFDASGTSLLYTLRRADSTQWVALSALPPHVVSATLQADDPAFLTRPGRTTADMLAGLFENWLAATQPPDTSITGRLVRSVIAPALDTSGPADVNTARAQEIVLAAELERRYTREDILEWALNTYFYGNEAYGIEAAAQLYFNKRAVDLTLDEAALLAAIPSAPQYNPINSEIAARGRQGDVLRAMFNSNLIAPDAYEQASAQITPVVRGSYLPPLAPEFTVYARRQAAAILDSLGLDGTRLVALGGLRITTTLDLGLNTEIECLRAASIARLNSTTPPATCAGSARLGTAAVAGLPPDSAALLVLNARTGEIMAMAGDAVSVEHPPGPVLQPFVYLDGMLQGTSTPASMVFDIPNQFPGAQEGLIYTFSNPGQPFSGAMAVRQAMGSWRLPPAAEVAYRQGMPDVVATAHSLGVNSLEEARADVLLLERGGAVSLLDIAYAYSVFATLGDLRGVAAPSGARGFRSRDPVAVRRIEDAQGNLLWAYDAEKARTCAGLEGCTPLLEPGAAYLINDILADQETRWALYGQGSPFDTSMAAAIVAGIANDGQRHWTVGYSSEYVVGALFYRVDDEPVGFVPGVITAAAAPWNAVIETLHAGQAAPAPWVRPASIVEAVVCQTSGLLPNGACPVITEFFLDGTQPQTVDTHWQVVEVNDQSGRLANFNTPPELRRQARFFIPPAGPALDWWVANQQPLPPTDYDDVSRPQIFETVRIERPEPFDYIGGPVDVYAQIDPDGVRYVQLEFGAGLNPTQWLTLGGQQTAFNGTLPLATWDTTALDGLYSLRLIAVMEDQSRQSDALQVTIDNQPPVVRLNAVEPGKIYRWPADDAVALAAELTDNLKIDRAEFYYGDLLLGADVSWPYSIEWPITGLGTHTFTVVAFDAVGNQSSSSLSVEVIRSGA